MENELVESVLNWWKEHKYDTVSAGDDEYNIYDDEPEFVFIARKIKSKNKEIRG